MSDTTSEIQLTNGGHQGKARARRSRPAYGTDLHRVERLPEELEDMAQRLHGCTGTWSAARTETPGLSSAP